MQTVPAIVLALLSLCAACDFPCQQGCTSEEIDNAPIALDEEVSSRPEARALSAASILERYEAFPPLDFEVQWDNARFSPQQGIALVELDLDPTSARGARRITRETLCSSSAGPIRSQSLEFQVDAELRIDGSDLPVAAAAVIRWTGYSVTLEPRLPVDAFYPALDITGLEPDKHWEIEGWILPDLVGVADARFSLVDPDTGRGSLVASLVDFPD